MKKNWLILCLGFFLFEFSFAALSNEEKLVVGIVSSFANVNLKIESVENFGNEQFCFNFVNLFLDSLGGTTAVFHAAAGKEKDFVLSLIHVLQKIITISQGLAGDLLENVFRYLKQKKDFGFDAIYPFDPYETFLEGKSIYTKITEHRRSSYGKVPFSVPYVSVAKAIAVFYYILPHFLLDSNNRTYLIDGFNEFNYLHEKFVDEPAVLEDIRRQHLAAGEILDLLYPKVAFAAALTREETELILERRASGRTASAAAAADEYPQSPELTQFSDSQVTLPGENPTRCSAVDRAWSMALGAVPSLSILTRSEGKSSEMMSSQFSDAQRLEQ